MRISKSVIITISYIILSIITGLWILLFKDETIIKVSSYSHFVNSCFLIFAVFLFLKKVDIAIFTNPFRAEKKYYLFGIIMGVLFIFIQYLLLSLLYYFFDFNESLGYNFDPLKLLNVQSVATILLVPVTEEFLFRGYIQCGLQKRYNHIVAIIISSLLFSLIHFPTHILYLEYHDISFSIIKSFSQMYHTFFGGLLLGWLFYKSKSVGPPIAMHIVWNIMAITF